MRHVLLSMLIVIATAQAIAQNLVIDPGFEAYKTCPNKPGQTSYSVYWFQPTVGTSDFFHACSDSIGGQVGVPNNTFGQQVVSSGNGYGGLYAFNNQSADIKEYLATGLRAPGCDSNALCPTTIGKYYKVSMDVSLAETYSSAGCSGLGAYFFTSTPPGYMTSLSSTIPRTPQIDYSSYGIIMDSINWVTLVDTFQADSEYYYLVVGGVQAYLNQSFTVRKSAYNNVYNSYYYVDNVKVEPLAITALPAIKKAEIAVSPNPLKDKTTFRISGSLGAPWQVSLTNMTGQTVWRRSVSSGNEVEFERQALPSGIYYYQVLIKGERIQFGKLVIE